MAVYTKINFEEFSSISSFYNIGELKSALGITKGVENSNYILTSINNNSEEKYIATIYEKRVDPQDIPFFLNLMGHLAKQNIPCPSPIKAKDGNYIRNINNKKLAIFNFLPGHELEKINEENCFAIGKLLASIHLAGKNFNQNRHNTMGFSAWQDMFLKIKDKADNIRNGLANEIKQALDFVTKNWPSSSALEYAIIHGDLFPDNVLFQNGKISGVIDFYFACNDYLAYDIAISINAWCFDQETQIKYSKTKADSLIKGYETVRKLSDQEKEKMPIFLKGAALRFLLSRLHDMLYHDNSAIVTPKDPMEYLSKLRELSVNSI